MTLGGQSSTFKKFESMIYAVSCMLYQEWRLQREMLLPCLNVGSFRTRHHGNFWPTLWPQELKLYRVCRCDADMCFYHFCCRTILWRRLFIGQDFCTSEGHHISWVKGLRVREREEHRLAPDSNYNFCLWKYRGCCENKKERVSQVVFHFSLDRNSNIREFSYKYSIESRRPENSSNKRGI